MGVKGGGGGGGGGKGEGGSYSHPGHHCTGGGEGCGEGGEGVGWGVEGGGGEQPFSKSCAEQKEDGVISGVENVHGAILRESPERE